MPKVKTSLFLASALLLVLLFAGTSFGFFGFLEKYSTVTAKDGKVTLATKDVNDGVARHYVFKSGSRDIKFFVLKSKDGVIRAAFDACDVCYREKKGYSQSGDYMICNNCGRRFHSTRINEVKGGCNPAPLKRTFDSRHVTFQVTDILEGASYF